MPKRTVGVCVLDAERQSKLTTPTPAPMVAPCKNPSSAPQTLRGHKMRLIERTPGRFGAPLLLG